MSDLVTERVTLYVGIQCNGCGRKLETSETIGGDSVRTGNTTQTARYWLDQMHQRIVGSATARQWKVLRADEAGGGYRCAHCIAAEVDKLGTTRRRTRRWEREQVSEAVWHRATCGTSWATGARPSADVFA